MKGFTRDHKFHPISEYKKVTRKSRDQKEKTVGVRMKKQRGFLFVKDAEKNRGKNERAVQDAFDVKTIQIWDGGNKVADRYTVIVRDDIFGMGENFDQFAGNVSQRDINTGELAFSDKNFGKKLDFVPKIVRDRLIQRYIVEDTGLVDFN